MVQLDKIKIKEFVEKNIKTFHESRLRNLENTKLKDLLKKKNPYMFKAKNLITAQDLVSGLLEAKLSSSEEKIFGDFLEDLAIYVAKKTKNASKSSSSGLDLEFEKNRIHYVISVKSGLNWGNSSQWKSLKSDFENAVKVLKQSSHTKQVQPILGICYGKAKTTLKRGIILQVCGQNFWYLMSGDDDFYTDIIEPIGYKADQLTNSFNEKKSELINKFTLEFIKEFCNKNGKINWDEIVTFNSGNLTPKDKEEFK